LRKRETKGVEEGTEEEGKEKGEEGEAWKNSEYKKAIGIVFWNVAEIKK